MKIKLLIFLFISSNIFSQVIEEGKGYNSINIGLKSSQIIQLLGDGYLEIVDQDEFIYDYTIKENIGIYFDKDSISYGIIINPKINKRTSKGLLIKEGLTKNEIEEIYGYRDWTLSEKEVLGYDCGITFHMKDNIVVNIEIEKQDEEYLDSSIQEYLDEVYIPKNLDECFIEIDKKLTKKDKNDICLMEENEFIRSSHFGLGFNLRNSWGLWKKSRLAVYFNNLGIYHPDDMSGIILTSLHRKLNEIDIDLDKQIKYYKDYWAESERKETERKKEEFSKFKIGDIVEFSYDYDFVSKKQEEKWDNDKCFAKGIVLELDASELKLKIKLKKSCDRKGIVILKSDVYNEINGKWILIEKDKIEIMKKGETRWTSFELWDVVE